jgi:hypothetical protein
MLTVLLVQLISEINKDFWEELIAYFPFAAILVSDAASRKKTFVRSIYG